MSRLDIKSDDYYRSLTDRLITAARNIGADLSVSLREGVEFGVTVRDKEIEELEEASSSVISLSVNIGNKVATATSNDLSTNMLDQLLLSTIERAKLSSVDDSAIFPTFQRLDFDPGKLELYSESIHSITPDKAILLAQQLEERCSSDSRITLSLGASFSRNEYHNVLALSNGFWGSSRRTSCSLGVGLQAGEEESAYQSGWSDSAIDQNRLLSVDEISIKAIEHTTRMLDARKIETQTLPVLVDRYVSGQIIGFLLQCINGRNIYTNQSLFTGKLGEQIANSNLTLYDEPLLPGALGSRAFDSEGIPCRHNLLIDKGVLSNYILNTYTSHKLRLPVNGMASGTSNLIMGPGKYQENDLIQSIDKGILLLDTIGQGTDTTTGGFSKGAFGIMIENGKLTYPVSEITISSSIDKMLMGIDKIGNNADERKS